MGKARNIATRGYYGSILLVSDNTAYTHSYDGSPNGQTEQTLASYVLPGGTMGINDCIRISTLWTMSETASDKRATIRWGGDRILYYSIGSTKESAQIITTITNAGSLSSQKSNSEGIFGFGTSGLSIQNMTENTASDVTIDIASIWLDVGTGETITLERYMIELIQVSY